MSEHRILTPYEVARSGPMTHDPLQLRMQLLNGWLSDVTGGTVETLYPARTCHGFTGGWDSEASGISRYELGVFALHQDAVDALNKTAVNPGTPEPLTRIHAQGKGPIRQIGYRVRSMGQEFTVDFYQGSTSPSRLPSPLGYWVMKGVFLEPIA
jgi:hypothetical protein